MILPLLLLRLLLDYGAAMSAAAKRTLLRRVLLACRKNPPFCSFTPFSHSGRNVVCMVFFVLDD